MPVDMKSVSASQAEVGKKAPGLTSDLLLSDEALQRLQLPDEVKPQEILSYLSRQAGRLKEVEYRHYNSFKVQSASIPPPPKPPAELDSGTMTHEDQLALQSLTGQAAGGVKTDDFIGAADKVLVQLEKQYGSVSASGSGKKGVIDWMIFSQIDQQKTKKDEEWDLVIQSMMKNKNVDAATLFLAMTYKFTDKYGTALNKAFKQFAVGKMEHQKKIAKLDIMPGKTLTAADTIRAQNEQQNFMTDTQMGMQVIQALKQKLDQVQNLGKSGIQAIHEGLSAQIRNLRT